MQGPEAMKDPAQIAAGGRIRIRDLLPAGGLLCAGLAGLAAASLQGVAGNGAWLVVAPPGYSLPETIGMVGAADGGLIDTGRFGNIVIAASAEPGFSDRLRAAGAWLVVPAPVTLGCGAAPAEGQTS
ncbi:hypothetical protein [Neotabrizicola sp. VNH66]|uniref:hypothetical protein n=1 Tax=Neotabrizicola sp. VNH66 TaxID=3400918 RepID=UPI003C09F079